MKDLATPQFAAQDHLSDTLFHFVSVHSLPARLNGGGLSEVQNSLSAFGSLHLTSTSPPLLTFGLIF